MENHQDRLASDSAASDADIVSRLSQRLRDERAAPAAESATTQHGGGSPSTIIIDMVRDLTRNVDEKEYDPNYVSIGPYHRRQNPDLARDGDKLRSLDAILARRPGAGPTAEDILRKLVDLEERARDRYAHKFTDMDSEEFLRALLLDACYVLHHFGGGGGGGGDGTEPSVHVVRDVFYLAENQIPFFIVDEVNKLTTTADGGVSATAEAIARCIHPFLKRQEYIARTLPAATLPAAGAEPGNLLHLLHMQLQPSSGTLLSASSASGGEAVYRWRRATEYRSAGVTFKSRRLGTSDARSILDVKLQRGVLRVPCLNIDNETWRILRNLMALEQRNPNPEAAGSHVTAYCVFMSQVACTEADVELLTRRGIIAHALGNSGQVAGLFSDLCKGIVFSLDDPGTNYLRATCQALEKQCHSRPGRWMARLRQEYFSNPWPAVGLLAATILLFSAVVQTVYTVLGYYSQGGNQKCYCI